jgi:hypothetical protein
MNYNQKSAIEAKLLASSNRQTIFRLVSTTQAFDDHVGVKEKPFTAR